MCEGGGAAVALGQHNGSQDHGDRYAGSIGRAEKHRREEYTLCLCALVTQRETRAGVFPRERS